MRDSGQLQKNNYYKRKKKIKITYLQQNKEVENLRKNNRKKEHI